jgi:hypothetical protein
MPAPDSHSRFACLKIKVKETSSLRCKLPPVNLFCSLPGSRTTSILKEIETFRREGGSFLQIPSTEPMLKAILATPTAQLLQVADQARDIDGDGIRHGQVSGGARLRSFCEVDTV